MNPEAHDVDKWACMKIEAFMNEFYVQDEKFARSLVAAIEDKFNPQQCPAEFQHVMRGFLLQFALSKSKAVAHSLNQLIKFYQPLLHRNDLNQMAMNAASAAIDTLLKGCGFNGGNMMLTHEEFLKFQGAIKTNRAEEAVDAAIKQAMQSQPEPPPPEVFNGLEKMSKKIRKKKT